MTKDKFLAAMVDTLTDFMQRNKLPFTAENLVTVHNSLKVRDSNYMQGAQPGQPQAQPGAPAYYPQPGVPAPGAPAPVDPRIAAGPSGMYAYSPAGGGFGTPYAGTPPAPPPPAPVAAPAPQCL